MTSWAEELVGVAGILALWEQFVVVKLGGGAVIGLAVIGN